MMTTFFIKKQKQPTLVFPMDDNMTVLLLMKGSKPSPSDILPSLQSGDIRDQLCRGAQLSPARKYK